MGVIQLLPEDFSLTLAVAGTEKKINLEWILDFMTQKNDISIN